MRRSTSRAIRVFLAFVGILFLEALLMTAEAEYADSAYPGVVFAAILLLSIGPWRLYLRAKWRRWLTDDYPCE